MTRPLDTTPRKHLRKGAGANTKFWLDPSVYTLNAVPSQAILQDIVASGLGYVRERWWPYDPGQNAAFDVLTEAGVGLFLFIGNMTYTTGQATADVAALVESPYADYVVAVCGPNEANAAQDKLWPGQAVALQEAIYTEVYRHKDFARQVALVSCALMHNNVKNLDHDYRALAKAGIQRWCHYGDFHYYPGNAGPIGNAAEAKRSREAFGKLPLWQSETGWTGADTDPLTAGRFSVEALLRNHLSGIVGTLLYEFADESQYVPGREGLFGLRTPTGPKPAYNRVRALLATPDGKQEFPGWLADYAKGVESDAGAVVTSEGGDYWTVYLLKQAQSRATIVVPSSQGHNRYTVELVNSMAVVTVNSLPDGRVDFALQD